MSFIDNSLLLTAVTISCLHTASGPDHYVPFIVFSRTRKWSVAKTIGWTALCGLGHVMSSLVIGMIGVVLGWQLSRFTAITEVRGGIAGWALLILGLFYLIWGLYKAIANRPHKHFDVYDDGDMYVYQHRHNESYVAPQKRIRVTPWILFVIFVMGPSEPLLPLLFYPAAQQSIPGIIMLVATFTLFTIITMVVMVLLGYYGFSMMKPVATERYMAAISGAAVTLCGAGMVFMGW